MSEYSYSQNDSDFSYSSKSKKSDPNLKVQLLQILKEKGVVDKLKTQVRQNLISEMAAKESIFKIKNTKSSEKKKEIDIFQHASLSVIADYLSSHNLPYSLSVFIPEIGLNGNKLYDVGEILRILQLDSQSEFCRKLKLMMSTAGKGFLWCLIKSVSDYHCSSRKETCIQTEKPEKFVPISEKMQKLDSQFEDRQKEGILKTQQIFEDRMVSYQRELEKRLRQEMENEIQRFKTHEVSMLKMKEEENISNIIKQKSKMLEEEYQGRLTALKERERLSQENVQRLMESQERENFLQRQQLMRDINNIRERELQNKKESDRMNRELEMMKDQHNIKLADLEKRNAKLHEMEMGFDLRIQQELNNIRLSEESRLLYKWKEVENSEAKLKETQFYLTSEKEMIENLKQELFRKQLLFNEMEVLNYPAMKEQNQTLQDQIKELKQQVEQQVAINNQDKHKIDCLIKQKMGPNFEQQVLTNELDRAREIFRREKSMIEEQKELLEKKLMEEIRNKRIIMDQYSQQQEMIEAMTRQPGDFKDNSYRSKPGYQSNRSRGNPLVSARQFTNREVSPHSLSENRHRLPLFDSNNFHDDCNCPQDCEEFANEAKQRLICLDEETEQVNKTYQQFKNRLANSSSQIGQIQPNPSTNLISESFKLGLEEGRKLNINTIDVDYTPAYSKQFQGIEKVQSSNIYASDKYPPILSSKIAKESNKFNDWNRSFSPQLQTENPFDRYSPDFSEKGKENGSMQLDNKGFVPQHNVEDELDNEPSKAGVAKEGYPHFHHTADSDGESDSTDVIKLNDDWKLSNNDQKPVASPLASDKGHLDHEPINDEFDIDPVVKQYMELVRQKKEANQTAHEVQLPPPTSKEEADNDLSEDIKTESQYSADVISEKKHLSGHSESDSFW